MTGSSQGSLCERDQVRHAAEPSSQEKKPPPWPSGDPDGSLERALMVLERVLAHRELKLGRGVRERKTW